ncbi:MAG: helix-turn-helix transcriptional regulator [Bacillota bacterium]
MKTEFGAFVKTMRIERKENLRQMAEKLGVSSAFLSAVEVGKKTAPKDLADRIAKLYDLSLSQANELKNAIDTDNNKVVIEMEAMDTTQREVSMMFARTINTASQKTLDELKEMLNNCK